MTDRITPSEESFDPRSPEEWAAFRTLSHRMVEEMVTRLESIAEEPTWREMPEQVRQALSAPVPRLGVGAEAAYAAFTENVLPYPIGNWHPRFFGWVMGQGTPFGMMADMLASGMNPNVGGFNDSPALVERQVVDWCGSMLGFEGAGGLLVTGGTMANTLGLAVGRFAKARELGRDVRANGVQAWPGEPIPAPMVCYGSAETHSWIRKATEWLGLGQRAFRAVPVDAEYRMDVAALEAMIVADRASGLVPFCVLGTAGTVNTGATDDLTALADICAREKLWFHVDGAFGALAYLSETLRPALRGLERADSLGFDMHKWGAMPYACACALIRDPLVHQDAFRATAAYLTPMTRGPIMGSLHFNDRGLDLSRGFKALSVWMSLKADGVDKLTRIVEQNVAQARYLAQRIDEHPELERLAPVPLNLVNYRFLAPEADEAELDSINRELLLRLQERGIAVPSSTTIRGHFAIRVANVNHRARTADFDVLVDAVVRLGREIVAERATLPAAHASLM